MKVKNDKIVILAPEYVSEKNMALFGERLEYGLNSDKRVMMMQGEIRIFKLKKNTTVEVVQGEKKVTDSKLKRLFKKLRGIK